MPLRMSTGSTASQMRSMRIIETVLATRPRSRPQPVWASSPAPARRLVAAGSQSLATVQPAGSGAAPSRASRRRPRRWTLVCLAAPDHRASHRSPSTAPGSDSGRVQCDARDRGTWFVAGLQNLCLEGFAVHTPCVPLCRSV